MIPVWLLVLGACLAVAWLLIAVFAPQSARVKFGIAVGAVFVWALIMFGPWLLRVVGRG